MPRKTRRITEEFEDDDRKRETIDMKGTDTAELEYENLLTKEGAEGCVIKLYRQNPHGSGREYLLQGLPSEITEEYIRLYHAQQANAHESAIYFRNVEVHGVLRSSFPTRIGPQVATPGASAIPHVSSNGSNELMMRMIQEQNAMLMRVLTERNGQRESITDLAGALKTLDEMRGPKQETPTDVVIKAIELGAKMKGEGGGDNDSWQGAIMELLKSAGPLIGQVIGGLAVKNQPTALQNPPAGTVQMEGVQPMNEEQGRAMLMTAVDFLKQKCLSNRDPRLYVAFICDNAELAPYDQLVSRIVTEEFSFFETLDPEIGKPPYRAFFDYIFNGVRSWANGENPMDDDTTGENGNVSNAPKDEGAKPKRRK